MIADLSLGLLVRQLVPQGLPLRECIKQWLISVGELLFVIEPRMSQESNAEHQGQHCFSSDAIGPADQYETHKTRSSSLVRTMQFLANTSMVDLCAQAIAGVQDGATGCQ